MLNPLHARFTFYLPAAFFLISFVICSCTLPSETDPYHTLILDKIRPSDNIELPGKAPAFTRWQAVKLNPAVLNRDRIEKEDEILLNLFPDAEYRAVIEKVYENVKGTTVIRGRIKNHQAGYLIITRSDKQTLINIQDPKENKRYRIQNYSGQGDYSYLFELDIEKMDIKEDAPPLIPRGNSGN